MVDLFPRRVNVDLAEQVQLDKNTVFVLLDLMFPFFILVNCQICANLPNQGSDFHESMLAKLTITNEANNKGVNLSKNHVV